MATADNPTIQKTEDSYVVDFGDNTVMLTFDQASNQKEALKQAKEIYASLNNKEHTDE